MKKFRKNIFYVFTFLLFIVLPASNRVKDQEILVEWTDVSSRKRIEGFRISLATDGNRIIDVITVPEGKDVDKTLKNLRGTPGVVSAELNSLYHAAEVSTDPLFLFGGSWGMYSPSSKTIGPFTRNNQFGSRADLAWDSGHIGNTRVVVGVVDTGIDYTHPDLYLNIYLNQGEIKKLPFFISLKDVDKDGLITFRDLNNSVNSDFVSDQNGNNRIDAGDLLSDPRWEDGVDNDSNGHIDDLAGWDFVNEDNDPMDDHCHGTHVAGTIGAIGGNGLGVAGVNWKVQLMPIKALDWAANGELKSVISSLDYYTAETLAKDTLFNSESSLTFIGTNNSWVSRKKSPILLRSIIAGARANNHFVTAAGNNSANNDSSPAYPANYSTVEGAGWEAITVVASITPDGSLSRFSNYGKSSVDIAAPGTHILSTALPGTYRTFSGTSMATPFVTGAFASLISSYPSSNRRVLREILLKTAKQTDSMLLKVSSKGALDIFSGLVGTGNQGKVY